MGIHVMCLDSTAVVYQDYGCNCTAFLMSVAACLQSPGIGRDVSGRMVCSRLNELDRPLLFKSQICHVANMAIRCYRCVVLLICSPVDSYYSWVLGVNTLVAKGLCHVGRCRLDPCLIR